MPSNFPDVMEIAATYSNWFLCTGGREGVRITFGESFDKGDEWVVGHQATHMSLQTAIKLYNMLGGVVQSLIDLQQKDLQASIAKIIDKTAAEANIPENKKN
jgi:hypothetical protein